jgi:hypothetical protein
MREGEALCHHNPPEKKKCQLQQAEKKRKEKRSSKLTHIRATVSTPRPQDIHIHVPTNVDI